jgi:hypothetical protein
MLYKKIIVILNNKLYYKIIVNSLRIWIIYIIYSTLFLKTFIKYIDRKNILNNNKIFLLSLNFYYHLIFYLIYK